MDRINRRQWLGMLAGGAAVGSLPVLTGGCAAGKPAAMSLKRSDFYDAEDKFKPEAAKDAYIEFMERKGYIASKNLRDNMWVADFALGRFLEVGMGGMFWINNKDDGFTALEMMLFPGQMVPEHWHVQTPDAKAKMEVWHVRWGEIYTYGPGEATPNMKANIPQGGGPHVTVKHERIVHIGEVHGISKPLEVHWMAAGPEGAILTEYSTYHDNNGVKFTNPKATL